jgi:hypothetical protein
MRSREVAMDVFIVELLVNRIVYYSNGVLYAEIHRCVVNLLVAMQATSHSGGVLGLGEDSKIVSAAPPKYDSSVRKIR